MKELEMAQWLLIGLLVWRVFLLEASQLTKGDLSPIHRSLDELLTVQKRFMQAIRGNPNV